MKWIDNVLVGALIITGMFWPWIVAGLVLFGLILIFH